MEYLLFALTSFVAIALVALACAAGVFVVNLLGALLRRKTVAPPPPADGFRLKGMDGEELTGALQRSLRGGQLTWQGFRR